MKRCANASKKADLCAGGPRSGQGKDLTKHAPKFRIVAYVTGIQVIPDRAFEKGGILGDDGEPPPHVQEADRGGVEIVYRDIARCWLDDAEQGERERGLPGAGATDDANLLVGLDVEVDSLKD